MENMNRIQQFSTSIPSKRLEFEYAPRKVKIRMEKQKSSISYLGLEKLQELIENYLVDDKTWVGPKSKILEWKTRNQRTNQCLPRKECNATMMIMVMCMLYFNYGLTEQYHMNLDWIV